MLKESVGTAVSEEGSRILVRDAGGDAGLQNSQIHELIGEGGRGSLSLPGGSVCGHACPGGTR